MKPRIFSGVQPTGTPTIGNYIGAMKGFVELQDNFDAIYCVVNEHALTVPQDPIKLRRQTRELAALYLAMGIDPNKATLFVQSDVPAHTQAAWLIQCLTGLGELERMTQYKDKAQNQEAVSAGLLAYPALMVADIILYDAEYVPVGDDQRQHLELTRNFVDRFNNRFGKSLLVKPEPIFPEAGARVMSLQDPSKKMSKSDENQRGYISLLDDEDTLHRKIMAAVTDSIGVVNYDSDKQPAVTNLIDIYAALSDQTPDDIVAQYEGLRYGAFKGGLSDVVIERLIPIQSEYKKWIQSDDLDDVLMVGAQRANEIANTTLSRINSALGLGY